MIIDILLGAIIGVVVVVIAYTVAEIHASNKRCERIIREDELNQLKFWCMKHFEEKTK
jgi:uncharacterized membrane protein